MKTTSATLLAATLVTSLLLAGCGGADKPPTSALSTAGSAPTTTAAPSSNAASTSAASPTSTSASPKTDPNIPTAARAHTIAGAEAFVRYFYSQLNIAWTRPSAGILSPLCQTTSKACAANELTATRLVAEHHRYDGNPVTIRFIGVLDATNPNKYVVLANVVQERRNEIDRAGRIYVTDKRKSLRLNLELLYTGQEWSVSSTKLMN